MIEGVEFLQSVHELDASYLTNASLPYGPSERPTESQAADFARAAAVPPVHEVSAAPPPSPSVPAMSVVHDLETAASHLQTFKVGGDRLGTTVLPEHQLMHAESGPDWVDGAIAQLDGIYAFAIKTMMANRGSTEATKILNTLLKGQ
jgi:hypothetical protein